MKSKEYIILGVIIVLLGAYLLLRGGDNTQYDLPALPEAPADQVTKIEIATADQAVQLVREGENWLVGENRYPADASKVSDILAVLEDLQLTALASEAKAYTRYDLTDDKKISVRAWIGDRLVREMAIGKAADTYQHTFVRIGESTNVYHALNNFRRTFDETQDDLRDKTALSFDASDITGIAIVSGEKTLSLSLEQVQAEIADTENPEADAPAQPETVWKASDGSTEDTDTIQRLLSQLAYLNCSSYLDGKQKADFTAPSCTITLKGTQDYSLSLFEGAASYEGCPGISSHNDYPFILGETVYNRLNESLEKLLEEEEAAEK